MLNLNSRHEKRHRRISRGWIFILKIQCQIFDLYAGIYGNPREFHSGLGVSSQRICHSLGSIVKVENIAWFRRACKEVMTQVKVIFNWRYYIHNIILYSKVIFNWRYFLCDLTT